MTYPEYTLGISSHFHDSAAVLLRGSTILAAAQEERFTRRKGDWRLPESAIDYCRSFLPDPQAPCTTAFYENPAMKIDRVLHTARRVAPRGAAIWPRTLQMLRGYGQDLAKELEALGIEPRQVQCVPHHRSHAASAYYPSPFEDTAVLVVDGVGEWSTTSLWHGKAGRLTPLREVVFPHSLGMFYSAMTQYCGFRVNSGEYKLMGLAPFGVPRFEARIREHLIDLKADGSFQLNLDYFRFDTERSTISPLLDALFGEPRRRPEAALTPHFMDVAASAQAVLQTAMLQLAATSLKLCGVRNLCLAGGVALNCVANSRLLTDLEDLDRLWIQPAAGDAGGALGAALDVVSHQEGAGESAPRGKNHTDMAGTYLGPAFEREQVLAAIDAAGLHWQEPDDLPGQVARALEQGLIVGHFDGRMEYGPRALGNRSILADPRAKGMLSHVNQRIKFREAWRPFAPMVLKRHVGELFDGPQDSPYMLLVATLKEPFRHATDLAAARARGLHDPLSLMRAVNSEYSAVTHVDFSARLQTIDPGQSTSRAADILQSFYQLTGCPMLLNTSFNVRGEPIVCSPVDAVDCFRNTRMDVLAIGPFLVYRAQQDESIVEAIGSKRFAPD